MDFNILVMNLLILIFIIGIKCEKELPGWLYGNYIPHTAVNITTFHYMDHHLDYFTPIDKLQNLKNSLYDLNSKFNDHMYRCCTRTKKTKRPIFDIRYDALPAECLHGYHDNPTTCIEATECTHATGVYYIIQDKFSDEPFLVWCDVVTHGGDWTVIQRRHDGSEDFERTWCDYVNGFGDVAGEFFIGLEKLHALTTYNGPQELLIVLRDYNETKYALYDNFVVGSKHDMYRLSNLGAYRGTAGDSLGNHLLQKFSAKNMDNDILPDYNCALLYRGAWWYKDGHDSNLNGRYADNNHGTGINWYTFRGWNYSIPYVKMMIRRRTFNITS